METLSAVAGWANYLLSWAWLLWFGIGTMVGGIMLAHDEWRLHRRGPKPEQVQAHADWLINQHGQEAFRINGDAMIAARGALREAVRSLSLPQGGVWRVGQSTLRTQPFRPSTFSGTP